MSREKQIVAAVVVLAGMSGLAYWQWKKDATVGHPELTSAGDLPEIKGSDDLDKISIKNGDKPEIVLVKKGDKWMLSKPVDAAANQANVKSLIDNLKELKTKELISANVTEDQKKDFQLDPDHAVHVMAWKGNDKKVDDVFGKSGGRGQTMMVGDKPGVYVANGYTSFVYARETKGWRDTEVLKFDDSVANQLTIENKNGVFSFTKGDKWAGTAKGKPIDKLDEAKVKEALTAFHALNADDFGDGKTAAETGLDAPEATVTIALKDNAGKYVLKVGKTGGSGHYAAKDGDSTIYVIGSAPSDWAEADTAKFEAAADAGAAKQDAGGKTDGAAPKMPANIGLPPGHPKL